MVTGYEAIYQQVLASGDGASRVLGTRGTAYVEALEPIGLRRPFDSSGGWSTPSGARYESAV
jgi:hypothetical protein